MEEWPFVGRADAVSAILGLLDGARAVVVVGDAGVGKTRLVRHVADVARRRGWSTEAVFATDVAASIPFGAFAPLLPRAVSDQSPLGVLASVKQVLAPEDGAGTSPLLVVDDLHRLDVASAVLVHQIVTQQLCRVLATVRAGDAVADAIEGLWTSDWMTRVEIAPLPGAAIHELLEAALGGQVDGQTVHRLAELSEGNVLLLRELVHHGLQTAWLHQTAGVWRAVGTPSVPHRLVELIERRLAHLSAADRSALEHLAVAERIGLVQFSSLAGGDTVVNLERAGLAQVEPRGAEPIVALVHPALGEAARAAMPEVRRRQVSSALADLIEATDMRATGDVVRVATWRLDAGETGDPDLLARAARHAFIANDLALAERLATAARSAGGGFEAGFVLAEAVMLTGRHQLADELLAALEPEAGDVGAEVRLACARSHNLAQNLGDEQRAIAILERVLEEGDGEGDGVPDADPARARLAVIHAIAARAEQALEVAGPLLARPESPEHHRATYAAALALAVAGRLDDAVEMGMRGYAVHDALRAATRQSPETQFIGPILALCACDRLDRADELAEQGYEASIDEVDAEGQATFALLKGVVALRRGRVATALRHLREAASVNTTINDWVALRWSLGAEALAAALAGDPTGSSEARERLDGLKPPPVRILELDLVERGRAWSELARGDFSRGVATLRQAAQDAQRTGEPVAEAFLLHDLAMLGDAALVTRRLAELEAVVDGQVVGLFSAHAAAVARRDGTALEACASGFADAGFHLSALDAAVRAADLLRSEGQARRAAACEALARRSEARCEGARPPMIPRAASAARLTAREQEVAVLASRGLSSRLIAERLHVSSRTVENLLQRAYVKLGISNRRELPGVLEQPG